MAAILDRHMDGREFIVDDTISVADCVTAYVARDVARPAFKRAFDAQFAVFAAALSRR